MSRPRESIIVKRILDYLNTLYECYAVKNHGSPFQEAGRPDIFGCYFGQMFALEVKRADGKTTPAQENQMRLWRDAGAMVGVVRSIEDVQNVLLLMDEEVKQKAASL